MRTNRKIFLHNLYRAIVFRPAVDVSQPKVDSTSQPAADSQASQGEGVISPPTNQPEQNDNGTLPEAIPPSQPATIIERPKTGTFELDSEKLALLLVLSEEKFRPGTRRQNSHSSAPNIQTVIEKHERDRNLWPSVLSLLKGQAEIEGKMAVFKFRENASLTYDSACASTFQDDILNQAHKAEIIVFDFKNVQDLDVTILGTLNNFHKSLLRSNRQTVFIHISDSIKEKLGNEFLICDSLSEVIPFIESDKIKKYKT